MLVLHTDDIGFSRGPADRRRCGRVLSEALTIGGVACEVAGVLLIARPDATPYATEVSSWLRRRAAGAGRRGRRQLGAAKRRALRLLGRPVPQMIHVGDAVEVSDAGRITAAGIRGRTPDEKIAALAGRVEELEHSLGERIAEAIAAAEERHRPLRVGGAAFVVIGLGLIAAGTLIG